MTLGIVGKKIGMTRSFTEEGDSIPVTVIEILPNYVTQLLNVESQGYCAAQVAWGKKNIGKVNKPAAGLFTKVNIDPAAGLTECRLDAADLENFSVAEMIKVDFFTPGQRVDITGTTSGKGFAGVVKRHNFSSQRMTHGNSLSHRAPGSIGQCQTPGRVFKGKKMSGQMGNKRRTVQNLRVVNVDSERGLLLVKGAVPATRGGKVVIKPSVKSK